MGGCGDRIETSPLSRSQPISSPISTRQLAEVSTPPAIAKLQRLMEQYEPQVTILSPQKDEILQENTIKVQIKVQDLPIFQASNLELGPHLTLILDNQPSQAIYDLSEPVVLEELTPGTHTLRVFASKPWYESFKNDGAYAQTTFHVYTKNGNNTLDPTLPLLTYNRPRGTYGAEPILLDFYLTNAPLHVVAQENPDLADWRIKATINGESFLLDDWQSIYLTGFQKGENWVQLEFIDDKGNKVENTYNNTVRIITYDPALRDSLTQLVKGEISQEVAMAIVDQNYIIPQKPPVVEPEPVAEEEIPQPEPEEPQVTIEIPPEIELPPETLKPEDTLPELIEQPSVQEEKPIPQIILDESKTTEPVIPKPVVPLPETPLEKDSSDTKPSKWEDTLPELIEQPSVQEEKPIPQIILDESKTTEPVIPKPVVPLPETPLEKDSSDTKPSKWIDRLLKPFPFQKGARPPVAIPKTVEEPSISSPESQPQSLSPNPEPFKATEPVNPQIQLPDANLVAPNVPKFDNEPRKAAIPKLI
ncbi:FHA domain-containing protein [Chroococcus sp. FPU101]|nr:FHA domain-containing protein [Chroococcus sp. FPU101]